MKFKVDGVEYTQTQTFTWGKGSSHILEAPTSQTGNDSCVYTYTGWSDTGDRVHAVSPQEDSTYTVNYASIVTTVTVTVKALPTGKGLTVRVDGADYVEGGTFTWEKGLNHTIEAPTPQRGTDFQEYAYSGWSDTGDRVHGIAPKEEKTYNAYYTGANPTFWVHLDLGPTASQTTVTWSSLRDKTYSIFYSHDLLTWHLADDIVSGTYYGATYWIDDGLETGAPPSLAPQRFYRIRENP